MEGENIFAWRETFRDKKMDPQQRVDFYYNRLKDGYARAVMEAELNRQNSRRPKDEPDLRIQALFDAWASEATQSRLNRALARRRTRGLNIDPGQEIVDLGLAGLFRIKQVHESTMASRTWWWQVEERKRRLEAAQEVFPRFETVRRTTDNTPKTIHGNPINWRLEVLQDQSKFFWATGRKQEAAQIASQGISHALQEMGRILAENLSSRPEIVAHNVDLHLNDLKLLLPEEDFQRLIGLLSAKAVLEYRKGRALKDLGPLIGALRDITAVQQVKPNHHRFATLNWKTMTATLSPFYNHSRCGARERWRYLKITARNLWQTAKQDKKAVISSLLQMLF